MSYGGFFQPHISHIRVYISSISSCEIWTHEIDNMPIKIENPLYMLNKVPNLGIQIYMIVMKHKK